MYSLIIYLGWLCIVFGIMYSHRRRNKNAIITSWPAVGMLPGLLQNFSRQHQFATDILTQKSGGTFEFKGPTFLNLDFLMTCDPLNVHHILSTNFANYPKGPQVKEIFDVLGDGILNADSDLWRLQRRMFHLWNARNAKFDNLFVARVLWRKVVKDLAPFLDHASQTGIQVIIWCLFDLSYVLFVLWDTNIVVLRTQNRFSSLLIKGIFIQVLFLISRHYMMMVLGEFCTGNSFWRQPISVRSFSC